jgi:hypothetical protein
MQYNISSRQSNIYVSVPQNTLTFSTVETEFTMDRDWPVEISVACEGIWRTIVYPVTG